MRIATVDWNSVDDVLGAVAEAVEADGRVLLLFDSGLSALHESFIAAFAREVRRKEGRLIHVDGKKATSRETFYAECRKAIPLASYMGSNLDAVADVLRGEALSERRDKKTCWVWTDAHLLYAGDVESFSQFFEVMVSSARLTSHGDPQNPEQHRQPVAVVLTGLWEIFGAEAMREDSFLFRFGLPASTSTFPDRQTGLTVFRVPHH